MSEELEPTRNSPIVLYHTPDGKVTVDVFFAKDNFWLTQKAMAELFGVKIPAISKHLRNIFDSGELAEEAAISKMETVQTEGARQVSREVDFYNLDAVIAVGYRVNSIKATHFRIWATNTLREFMVKGFVINDQMLKNGRAFGQDYFDELLEKIREIRASERLFLRRFALRRYAPLPTPHALRSSRGRRSAARCPGAARNHRSWRNTGSGQAGMSRTESPRTSRWSGSPPEFC